MSNNRYNLDWNVWGNSPSKHQDKEPAPLQTLNDSKSRKETGQNKAVDDNCEILENTTVSPPKQQTTCTLTNARFLPDETTDFNKPCSIEVDVKGTPKGTISFALWATYKGEEYNLKHEKSAFPKNGKAQTDLELFYVDEHYDDLHCKGENDAFCEYYAKVTNKAAREIKSATFKMPQNSSAEKILDAYFEDTNGCKISLTKSNKTITFVLKTLNMTGKTTDIDLSNEYFIFECNSIKIENNLLKDFKITGDTSKLELTIKRKRQ